MRALATEVSFPSRRKVSATPLRGCPWPYAELTAGMRQRCEDVLPTLFEEGHDERVLVRGIEFWSIGIGAPSDICR